MDALEEINKKLHKEVLNIPSRQKHFGLLTLLFSWGTYTNAKRTKEIKQNLQLVQEQNNLKESQILEITHYLNPTMVQICKHCGVLYELDTRLLIFNKTLISTIKALSHVRYMLSVLSEVHTSVTQLTLGILSLKEGID